MNAVGDQAGAGVAPAVGVNLAGYLDSGIGLGETGRNVWRALEQAGVPVAPVPLTGVSSEAAAEAPARAPAEHPVNLVCANAEAMPAVRAELGPAFFEGRRTVALWWWEVPDFPERWRRAFDLLDEVWVGSHYVADAIAPVSPVPVVRMPVPIPAPQPAAGSREGLGLPDGFAFLSMFDLRSVPARKNPLGTIEAFARAFPPASGPVLMLKCLGAADRPEAHRQILTAAAARPDVHVIDRWLEREERDALIADCDCYLSLHRSEGLGQPIAEAGWLAKPVVATAYAGPMDFLSEANSFLVDFEEVPVGPGNEPYPPDSVWAEPDLDDAAGAMRRVVGEPGEAAERGRRLRQAVEAAHAPEMAGAAMGRRLARMHGLEAGRDPSKREDPTAALEQAIWAEPRGAPAGGLRGLARRAALRLARPQAVHQREVDEELLRAVRTLDEWVSGLAAAQASLQAEVAALRRARAGEAAEADAEREEAEAARARPPRSG